MNIIIDGDNGSICVPASEIARFARTRRSGGRLLFEESAESAESFEGVPESSHLLSCTVNFDGTEFTVFSDDHILYRSGGIAAIEKFCERGRISDRTHPAGDPCFMAEGVLAAYMLAEAEKLEGVRLRLTYTVSSSGKTKSFEVFLKESFLHNMFDSLCSRAVPFVKIEAEKRLCGIPSLDTMAFPYKEMRGAQKDFIGDAYRIAKRGGRMLVSAPTGVGKTVSALYPALRAMGRGEIDKVFYLTAKTVTGNSAAAACRVMAAQVPTLKCISVIAKERMCPMSLADTKKSGHCRMCPLMGEVGRVPYEERRDGALLELLQNYKVIDPAAVSATAKKYELCPYELSLDASEYCEVVICDYNYAFDPSVRFKRYFVEGRGRYMFLVDEAHNLPDRARDMYSAEFDAAVFIKLYKISGELFKNNVPLTDGIGAVIGKLREISQLCKSEERLDDKGRSVGCWLSSSMLSGLPEAMSQFLRAAAMAAAQDADAADVLEEALSASAEFLRSVTLFDGGFALYCEKTGSKLTVSVCCLDPSNMLSNMMSAAKSTVLFSATLTPMDYFADVLGCREAVRLELDSPYDPDNLCLFAYDGISTRYADRESFFDDVAEVIMSVAEAKEGNYIVYFPSYEYMKGVYEIFCEMAPDVKTAVQSRGMSYNDRNRFLAEFSSVGEETLVGFCVLGGAFAEGVDLKGEKLIGTVIVGTGLPKISARLNILSDYFENTRENGNDYAYTYPAMIKVQQAAGRVIRSESDRGVVVLVDDRYAKPETYRLFPKSWRHIKYTADPYSLNSALCDFWEREE